MKTYRNVSDRQVWANSADPDQTACSLIRVYTVCSSLCIFWMHYSKKTPSCSTFRVITINFPNPKISDTWKICCNHPKIWTKWLCRRAMLPQDADRIANSVDPDQTAPLGAVWSGSALFAQTYSSENLGSLWYFERGANFVVMHVVIYSFQLLWSTIKPENFLTP